MADVALEPRVANLEEMMADLIRQMDLSQKRIEENLRAHREQMDLSQKRNEEDLRVHREQMDLSQKRIEENLRAHREEMDLSQKRIEEGLRAHREEIDLSQKRIEEGLRAHREETDLSQKRIEENLRVHQERVEADLDAHQERVEADLRAHRAEWQAEVRRMNRHWGELANKMGTLAEDLVAPSLPHILGEVVACPENEAVSMAVRVRRAHPTHRSLIQEFDVIVSCGEYALFNETKSSLAPIDIDRLITKLTSAREYFQEYQGHKIIGSVATLYIDPSLVQYATRQGILALAVGDELMDVMNEPGFELKEF